MTRWLMAALAACFAVIQSVLFLAALLIAEDYRVGVGLLASALFFAWIGWRTWRKQPLG